MPEQDVGAFLSWLATERDVAAATQNQALNALVFLYHYSLKQPSSDSSITKIRISPFPQPQLRTSKAGNPPYPPKAR